MKFLFCLAYNEQGFVAGAEFMTVRPVLPPNKITKDEVKK
jgi:hypothetical protein